MVISANSVFKKITIIDKRGVACDDRETFNVSWGVDTNYQIGVAISIASILEKNKEQEKEFTFHIIADDFSDEYQSRLSKLATQYRTVIKLYEIDPNPLKKLPKTDIWPISIYYRLISFDYFSDKLNTLLYLDADIVCQSEVGELLHLNLERKYGAVVVDVESMQEKSAERLGNAAFHGTYFNSGVMLINMLEWRANRLTQKSFDLLSDEKIVSRLKYPDQDILNILLLGHALLLPRKFNTVFTLKSEFEDKNPDAYKQILRDDTVFIHYTGITKPWHDWADYASARFFRDIYKISPWSDIKYVHATKVYELKEKYKHLLHQGKTIAGLATAVKYNVKKIFKN